MRWDYAKTGKHSNTKSKTNPKNPPKTPKLEVTAKLQSWRRPLGYIDGKLQSRKDRQGAGGAGGVKVTTETLWS